MGHGVAAAGGLGMAGVAGGGGDRPGRQLVSTAGKEQHSHGGFGARGHTERAVKVGTWGWSRGESEGLVQADKGGGHTG